MSAAVHATPHWRPHVIGAGDPTGVGADARRRSPVTPVDVFRRGHPRDRTRRRSPAGAAARSVFVLQERQDERGGRDSEMPAGSRRTRRAGAAGDRHMVGLARDVLHYGEYHDASSAGTGPGPARAPANPTGRRSR